MALLTVPMGDYVAADATETDVRDTTDYMTVRFRQNLSTKNAAFEDPPNLTDEFVYQDEFVNYIMARAGSTPIVFALDNQPSIWDQDHPLVHPTKATYSEIVALGVEYSQAIKNVWSTAKVSGPVLYGWQAYVNFQNSPDYDTEGDFIDYYLAALADASETDGRRLLDYLDVRWWSEAQGGGLPVVSLDAGLEVSAARVQAPRSLLDEYYVEDSWIGYGLGTSGDTIHLIPRLQEKIDDNYPGTEIGISTWMFGGDGHISGGVAAADALGIFGREGVAFAAVEVRPDADYIEAAFRAFLDYDDAGSSFRDTSVRATSSDRLGSSVYASTDASDSTDLVIVAINKRTNERDVTLSISGDTGYTSSAVYELTDESPSLVPGPDLVADSPDVFTYQMPAMSVVVLVPAAP
jgi:hypothetical protein